MFTLKNISIYSNYPKYIVLYGTRKFSYFGSETYFDYVVTKNLSISLLKGGKLPENLITDSMYIDLENKLEKFNLSKLGTDYIINLMGTHYWYECIGAYPDNYIFVRTYECPMLETDPITPLK